MNIKNPKRYINAILVSVVGLSFAIPAYAQVITLPPHTKFVDCDQHGACAGMTVTCANNRTACCCQTGSGMQICKCILATNVHFCYAYSDCPG